MSTVTYADVSSRYTPFQYTYDCTGTIAEQIRPGYVLYWEQNADGTMFNVMVHGGQVTSFEWVDWSLPDPVLMHADTAMDPTSFLDAVYGFRPDSLKALGALFAQDDLITGGRGRDLLTGGAGNDRILGGSGRDRIDGGDGNDTIEGGTGTDAMKGGKGADVFVFGVADGPADTIVDFVPGQDRIDLRPTGAVLDFGGDVTFDAAAHQLLVDLDPGLPGAELVITVRGVAAISAGDLILA